MTSIQIGGDLLDQMRRETDPVEICDDAGTPIGVFVPGSAGMIEIGATEVSGEVWEEVDRRIAAGSPTIPAQMVIDRLRSGFYERKDTP